MNFKTRMRARSARARALAQIDAYKQLNALAVRVGEGLEGSTAVYAFDTGAVEVFRWAAGAGRPRILEQCVAPRSTQLRVARDLALADGKDPDVVVDHETFALLGAREREEWGLASIILCPSEFVLNELLAEGVPRKKLRFVPYAVPVLTPIRITRPASSGRMRVLFVGNDARRKGLSMVLEAARLRQQYEFLLAGELDHQTDAELRTRGRNVRILGKLDRDELAKVFSESDIFLFPSRLEGSALVTYEALSWGLPVITTRQAGSVIRDGIEGRIIGVDRVDQIVAALDELANPRLRDEMSQRAIARIRNFSMANYQSSLLGILQEFDASHGGRNQ